MAAIPKTTDNRLLDAALEYATRGNPIFPLLPRGKKPAIPNPHPKGSVERDTCTGECGLDGHGLHDATTDERKIIAWWTKYPNANIGLRTGAPSRTYIADVDPEHDGEASWAALVAEHGDTPTLTSLTGGDGLHLVYAHPGPDVELGNTASKLGRGIDTRGDGGYVVAPPSIHETGNRYDWLDPSVEPAPLPQWIRDAVTKEKPVERAGSERPRDYEPSGDTTKYARVALDAQVDDVARAPQGQRNHTLNAAAFRMGQLVAGGQISEPTVVDELTAAAARAGIGGNEVAATIRSGLTSGEREPQYPDPARTSSRSTSSKSSTPREVVTPDIADYAPPVDEPPPDDAPPSPPEREVVDDEDDPDGEINETDLGNARRLIKRHGHELRYATHLRGWLRWDGRRWRVDDDGYVERCAHGTAQSIVLEAAGLADPDDRKKRFSWSLKSENARPLEAMVRRAAHLRGVPIVATQLDADPWLLNVLNGTVDLRTGDLRPHRPADLLTKLAPVVYDPVARDDRWDAYLASALPDPELVDWVQRAVGYTCTGDTSEEVLFFVHGPTRAGKSTFLEAIKAALGDYARSADFETFLDRDHGGTARGDIARLAGARLVTSNEVDEGRKLAEGLVKTLTGGDTITARFLYRDEFEYLPQFKLWLAANHKPKVRHGDDAIWRRIRLLPFVHPPATVDPELKTHLARDAGARSAILAWAIRGCQQWRDRGLRSVVAVREATEAYRAEQDPLAEFFADHCFFDPGDDNCWVTGVYLRSAYEEWAKEQGIKRTLSPNHFRELLEDRGCVGDRKRIDGKITRFWRGVRLLMINEEPPPPMLPGITVTPGTPAAPVQQVQGNAVTPGTEEKERAARAEQNQGSQESPNARAHERELPEQAIRPARAAHPAVPGETAVPDTLLDSRSSESADEGWTRCSEPGCITLVLPAPGSVERGWKTYCREHEPF